MGYGCDIGHRKLAKISNQINENELENVVTWYFSLQNVQNANDKILRFISQLELPKLYQIDDKPLHLNAIKTAMTAQLSADSCYQRVNL